MEVPLAVMLNGKKNFEKKSGAKERSHGCGLSDRYDLWQFLVLDNQITILPLNSFTTEVLQSAEVAKLTF